MRTPIHNRVAFPEHNMIIIDSSSQHQWGVGLPARYISRQPALFPDFSRESAPVGWVD